jgi:hypothetical protein
LESPVHLDQPKVYPGETVKQQSLDGSRIGDE